MKSKNSFTNTIEVNPSHIDERNHVNNLLYLQWCIETAEDHWKKTTTPEMRDPYVWYVLNHNITYKAAAFKNDVLTVTTWVTKAEGVRSERCYEIVRPKDGKVLVVAETQWCFVNASTLRPTTIPEEICTLFL